MLDKARSPSAAEIEDDVFEEVGDVAVEPAADDSALREPELDGFREREPLEVAVFVVARDRWFVVAVVGATLTR